MIRTRPRAAGFSRRSAGWRARSIWFLRVIDDVDHINRCRRTPSFRSDPEASSRRSLEVGDAMRLIVVAPLDAQRRPDVAARSTAADGTRQESPMTQKMLRRHSGALAGAVAGSAATGLFAVSRYRGAIPRRLTAFAIADQSEQVKSTSGLRRCPQQTAPEGSLSDYLKMPKAGPTKTATLEP
jgi:hypothetical protein